nr:hypothetical protein [Fortiea contorta]
MTQELLTEQQTPTASARGNLGIILKKVRGGLLLVIGFLLSPMSWWNDLIFNLPVAYGFGYLCSLISPNLLIPCSIIGYWLSNIVGILLMQLGLQEVVQGEPKQRNLKKELIMGLASSTIYTLVILVLIHFHILDTPLLFPSN